MSNIDRLIELRVRNIDQGVEVDPCLQLSDGLPHGSAFFVQSETPKSAPKPDRLGCRGPRHVDVRNFGGPKHPHAPARANIGGFGTPRGLC
jgi:hypothetical protein